MMQACEPLLKQCCAEVRDMPGDAAELGVWLGCSAALILKELPGCMLHLFDTFSGMPACQVTAGLDEHVAGNFPNLGGESNVRRRLADWSDRCVYHAGVFPDTACDVAPLKFVHIDVDLYLSTKAAIAWAAKWLLPGGVILSDDYGCGSTRGAKLAVDEFLKLHHGQFSFSREGSRAVIRRL